MLFNKMIGVCPKVSRDTSFDPAPDGIPDFENSGGPFL